MQLPAAKIRENRTKTLAGKVVLAGSSLILLGLIGTLDYLTGREISFGIFYFLPIWLATWQFNFTAGAAISLLCALVWFAVDKTSGQPYSTPLIPLWNAVVRLVYFLTFALLLSNIRERLRRTEKEVRRLSGLLPICASCKKIRDEEGHWEDVETYIRDHSDTDFSHGICPDCAKKLYPEFSDKLLKKREQTGFASREKAD